MNRNQIIRKIINNRIFNIFIHFKNGNTVANYANRIGIENWKKAEKQSNFPKSKLREEFFNKGYVSLPTDLLTSDLIVELQNQFALAIQDDQQSSCGFDDLVIFKAYNHGGYIGRVDQFRRNIIDTSKSMPAIFKIWENPVFKATLEELMGCAYTTDGVDAWRINHVPESVYEKFEATTNRLHFDHQYVDRVKIFIFLSDVKLESGPFQNFSKRYSRYLLLKGFRDAKRSESITSGLPKNILNSSHLIKHTGAAGQIVVCATSFCLHRAGEVMPGHQRDMLQLCIRPKVL